MRIAQLAPFWFRVPPVDYGGTERVVSFVTEELVRRGHDVTLFAASGSQTAAKLESPVSAEEVAKIRAYNDPEFRRINELVTQSVFDRAADFDIIHSHNAFFSFPFCDTSPVPVVHTLHNQLPRSDEAENALYRQYRHLLFVSISDSFRTHFDLNYVATVYHGIPVDVFFFNATPKADLFWIGRASKHKGELAAMEAARLAGRKIRMALSIRPDTRKYFDEAIAPQIGPHVEIVENLRYLDTPKLYGDSRALLFPVEWEEPFGLIMIEAMATGTPVIAYNRGSVPEIVVDGVTGFIVEPDATPNSSRLSNLSHWIIKKTGIAGLVEAIGRIGEIDRAACRRHVEEHFTVGKMTASYEEVYRKILSGK